MHTGMGDWVGEQHPGCPGDEDILGRQSHPVLARKVQANQDELVTMKAMSGTL